MLDNAIKSVWGRYSHADLLMTLALVALIALAWRESNVDLHNFGESVCWIFGGRGIHAAGQGWGQGQQQ